MDGMGAISKVCIFILLAFNLQTCFHLPQYVSMVNGEDAKRLYKMSTKCSGSPSKGAGRRQKERPSPECTCTFCIYKLTNRTILYTEMVPVSPYAMCATTTNIRLMMCALCVRSLTMVRHSVGAIAWRNGAQRGRGQNDEAHIIKLSYSYVSVWDLLK